VVATDELIANPQFDAGLAGWAVSDAVLVNSQLRAGKSALNVGWRSLYAVAPGKLEAGKSYTLRMKARNEKTVGSAVISMTFRLADGVGKERVYQKTLTANTYQDYVIDFRAPAYTSKAEVSVVTNGTRVIVDTASLKMRAELPQTEPITSSVGSYVPAGYSLAFNDEFNGSSLNTSKWYTRYINADATMDRLNDEKQRYRDNNNHQLANGVLSLVARQVSTTDPNGINFESGMIRSDWTARYGYFEARVKMPAALGIWPGFWLLSDVSANGVLSWPPELDIFEFVNNGVEDKVNMLHSGVVTRPTLPSQLLYADAAFNSAWTFWTAPFNFNEGWHTVGTEWTPDRVTTYVDGKKIYSRGYQWNYTDGTPAGPAHILLNLAVGGSWAGRHGIDTAAFPQALQIDWVRAYKKN